MADTEHQTHLKTLRDKLVEARSSKVRLAIENNFEIGSEQFVELQEKIEAVDRALEDEKKLKPSYLETQGLRTV